MLDIIRSYFKRDYQLANISLITGHLSDIVAILDSECICDPSLKNLAIDAVIKLLQEHKDKPTGK